MATYARTLPLPERSFFLFGPRGTGKTTWLRQELPAARWFDLVRGPLLETYVLGELRAWLNVAGVGGQLAYWRTPSGSEVDFVWSRGARAVGVEVKGVDALAFG